MLSDILHVVDCGYVAALILLDLSITFDSTDHDIILQYMYLQVAFGTNDVVYLSGHSGWLQHVSHGLNKSSIAHLMCDKPQGSLQGPILLILYTEDLIPLIKIVAWALLTHLYADNTQVYGSSGLLAWFHFLWNYPDVSMKHPAARRQTDSSRILTKSRSFVVQWMGTSINYRPPHSQSMGWSWPSKIHPWSHISIF